MGMTNQSKLSTLCVHDFWAKTTEDGRPGVSVLGHSINTGAVAEAIISQLPPRVRNLFGAGVVPLTALHDIGKISVGFARKCPAWLSLHSLGSEDESGCWYCSEPNHSLTGQGLLERILSPQAQLWAAAVGAHHGKVLGRKVGLRKDYQGDDLAAARQAIQQRITEIFGRLPESSPKADLSELWLLAGLVTVSDWIASNEDFFPVEQDISAAEARQRASTILDVLDFKAGVHRIADFSQIFSFAPNHLQEALYAEATRPGLFIVEGPMGCGKTEAALALAHQLICNGQNSGIYFGLPTQVTSNLIHSRVAAFLSKVLDSAARLRLAHSTSWMSDQFNLQLGATGNSPLDAEGRAWFASGKRALLARYGVGTVDQALQAVVATKHFFVRRFGLAGKVVILDEVHSYDVYTGTLITELIRELLALNCTVIILSATLTQQRRADLLRAATERSAPESDAYPLITIARADEDVLSIAIPWEERKTVHLQSCSFTQERILAECIRRAEAGEHVMYIRNTVAEAQDAFRMFKSAVREGVEVGLLHSRFPFFRRAEIEAHWLTKLGKTRTDGGPGSILVATQVVEQSVDIDLDFIVSDLAPIDMLLQRMGRLWRHKRAYREVTGLQPEFWVNLPTITDEAPIKKQLGKSAKVYAPYVLVRTMRALSNKAAVVLPNDIRSLIEATYSEPMQDEPAEWGNLRRELELEKKNLELSALASTGGFGVTDNSDDEEKLTRLSDIPTTQTVIIRSSESLGAGQHRIRLLDGSTIEVDEHKWTRTHAKSIFQNSVRLSTWMIPKSMPPKWLSTFVPGAAAVVKIEENGESTPAGIRYHPDSGVAQEKKPSNDKTPQEDESYY